MGSEVTLVGKGCEAERPSSNMARASSHGPCGPQSSTKSLLQYTQVSFLRWEFALEVRLSLFHVLLAYPG